MEGQRREDLELGPVIDVGAGYIVSQPRASEVYNPGPVPYLESDDDEPASRRSKREEEEKSHPWVIWTMTMLCLAGFNYEIYLNDWQLEPSGQMGPPPDILLDAGAKSVNRIVDHNEWWRLFSAIYLHGGIPHLLFNCMAMLNIGSEIEQNYGHWRTFQLFMYTGLFGNIISCIFVPQVLTVGASGSVFGLLGAVWSDIIMNRSDYSRCDIFRMTLITILNLALGLMPVIDNFCHLGGFIGGVILGVGFNNRKARESERRRGADDSPSPRMRKARARAIIILIFMNLLCLAGLVLVALESAGTDWCPNCKFISCVPTSWWDCEASQYVSYSCILQSQGDYIVAVECEDGRVTAIDAARQLTQYNAICYDYCK